MSVSSRHHKTGGGCMDRTQVHQKDTYRQKRQTTVRTLAHRSNLEWAVSLSCMFMVCGRKQSEKTHAWTRWTCKLHPERPQAVSHTCDLLFDSWQLYWCVMHYLSLSQTSMFIKLYFEKEESEIEKSCLKKDFRTSDVRWHDEWGGISLPPHASSETCKHWAQIPDCWQKTCSDFSTD